MIYSKSMIQQAPPFGRLRKSRAPPKALNEGVLLKPSNKGPSYDFKVYTIHLQHSPEAPSTPIFTDSGPKVCPLNSGLFEAAVYRAASAFRAPALLNRPVREVHEGV